MTETTGTLEPLSIEEENGLPPALPETKPHKKDNSRFTKKRSKKKIIFLIVVLAAAGATAWFMLGRKPAIPVTATTSLARQELAKIVSLTGTVESADAVQVYSTLTSTVMGVDVQVGDKVEAGDVLGRLDTESLMLDIAEQQASINKNSRSTQHTLETTQKKLENAQSNVDNNLDSQLLSAENALRSAQQELNDARRDLNDHKDDLDHADNVINTLEKKKNRAYDAMTDAKRAYDQAEREGKLTDAIRKDYDDKLAAYETLLKEYNSANDEYGGDLSTYSRTYHRARTAYETALATRDSIKNSTGQTLDELADSVKSVEIESDLTSQQIALQKLQKSLDDSTIKAPISGTVTAVYAKEGAPGSGLLFIIEDTDHLLVKTKLKEYDVATVAEGMVASIKSDATGETAFDGKVERIYPAAVKTAAGEMQTQGSVEFETDVALNNQNTGLRVGMNARVTVTTQKKDNVWAVPFDAVTTSPEGGDMIYVAKPGEGENAGKYFATAVPVTTGMETDFYIEVSSDSLADGDQIINDPTTVTPGMEMALMPGAIPAGASSAAPAAASSGTEG